MAQIYGELIRAQLQSSASDLSPTAPGLFYLNSGDKKPTLYDGTAWQKLVTQASLTDLSALPIITPAKGGLGADASAFTGVLKASSGTFSASTIVNADVSATADIAQSKIANLTTDLSAKIAANAAITGATKTKITYDAKGLVTAGADLVSADIPATLLSKVVSSTAAMTGALTLPVGTTADRTGLSTQGMVRYNTTDSTFEGYNGTAWGAIGGGGGGTIDTITQASHGFVVGDVLYLVGTTYTKAIATSSAAAEVVGVVSSVVSSSQFQLTLSGEVTGLTGLTAGEVYFLSAATAGLLTITEPSVIGQVSVPVGVASSTTTMYVAPKRGVVIGGVNARAQVSLTTAATTNVQTVAGMTAGDLSGWVFISSAAPVRFYISAKFALSGAGGDYNLSYQTSGDVPPVGFSMTITTAGMIQITLPASSGSTSVINYAINAPAIGASFPLTVNADTILSGTVGAARLPAPSAYADAEATRMGLKQYLHGTAYNGGNAPTVTLTAGGGTLSTPRAVFLPYQLQDGGWRLKFNIYGPLSSAVRTTLTYAINGVVFKSGVTQPTAGFISGALVPPRTATGDNNGNIIFDFASTTTTQGSVSGDVELESKPTWAY